MQCAERADPILDTLKTIELILPWVRQDPPDIHKPSNPSSTNRATIYVRRFLGQLLQISCSMSRGMFPHTISLVTTHIKIAEELRRSGLLPNSLIPVVLSSWILFPFLKYVPE